MCCRNSERESCARRFHEGWGTHIGGKVHNPKDLGCATRPFYFRCKCKLLKMYSLRG